MRKVNLALFLSDWYCRKLGLMVHVGKVTSDKKMICNWYSRYKCGNWDYCSHFTVIFKITNKFLIVFVRLILGKVEFDGFIEQRQKVKIRYEFDLKVIRGSCRRFWLNFQARIKFVCVFKRLILPKFGLTDLPSQPGKWRQTCISF